MTRAEVGALLAAAAHVRDLGVDLDAALDDVRYQVRGEEKFSFAVEVLSRAADAVEDLLPLLHSAHAAVRAHAREVYQVDTLPSDRGWGHMKGGES